MSRYRKKPVVIEAEQFDGSRECANDLIVWMGAGSARFPSEQGTPPNPLVIVHTLEGDMAAMPGDWIIRGVKGEFYPVKNDIFRATYDAVDEDG